MKLIAIAGKARSGKDTVANRLITRHGFAGYSFAQPLKTGLQAIFGLSQEHVDGSLKEEIVDWIGKSPRQMLQTLGTEWGRNLIHPNIWVMVAQQHYLRLTSTRKFEGMVIPDVRFENEAKWVRDSGGLIIHISRSDAPEVAAHSSEDGISIYSEDVILQNDSTVHNLYTRVDFLASNYSAGVIVA